VDIGENNLKIFQDGGEEGIREKGLASLLLGQLGFKAFQLLELLFFLLQDRARKQKGR